MQNYSRSGVLFTSPEPLEVGETVEIRLLNAESNPESKQVRLPGRVVRLEELPPPENAAGGQGVGDLYEVGVALDEGAGTPEVLELLERARQGRPGWP